MFHVLPGVTGFRKDKPGSCTTINLNGQYVIRVNPIGTLVFRYMGYLEQEIKVAGRKEIHMELQETDASTVEEVVVTAFGQKQKILDLVSYITSVKPEELKMASTYLTTALQGKVASVIAYQ